jgi:isoquinoline 1-oxidoreductase beta subunit
VKKPPAYPVDAGPSGQQHLQAAQRSRRHFLGVSAGLGLAGGGLVLGFTLSARASLASTAVISGDGMASPPASDFAPNAFLRIDRAGQISLVIPKVEMGQGVYTSIPMLVAEELEVGLDQVHLEHAPPDAALYSDPNLGGQLTGGSTSPHHADQRGCPAVEGRCRKLSCRAR